MSEAGARAIKKQALAAAMLKRNSNYTFYNGTDQNDTIDWDRFKKHLQYFQETAEIGTRFAKAFTVLGIITLCINISILIILCAHKRLVMQQVFYLLIINFAIIDSLKGICLTSHALRFILPPSVFEEQKVLGTKFDQYVFIFFRLFNLATVFNLLMITLNEFVFIKFPLRYHQIVRRKLVLILVFVSWAISVAFTVASSLAKSKGETVFVSMNNTLNANDTSPTFRGGGGKNLRRSAASTDTELNTLFTLALTGFCIFSLVVVLVCYLIFFKIIRDIQKYDTSLHSNANRRMSETSLQSTDLQHLDDRKIKRQLLKRYKYVLVIGSVIVVYMLYLISYTCIQILQRFSVNLDATVETVRHTLVTRWVLVLLCGLHSAFQPLCYFRIREFREIVNRILGYPCKRGRRRADRVEYLTSINEGNVTAPLTSTNHHQNAAAVAAECRTGGESESAKITTPPPPSYRSAMANHGESRQARKQSVVHFEEGKLLTLSRRTSNIDNGNQL